MSLNTSTIQAGVLVGGKYLIDRQLGAGGMGAVYLAENTDIGRKVAIKVLHADFASNPDLIRRFRQEARAAAAIGHPGIVDVLDMGTTADGSAFIVMERLDGETLGARIEHLGRLAVKAACLVVADVLEALAAAHDKQIIHRDLKPDNVFLVERPVAITKILDFGISKLQGAEDVSLTRTGAVMGTPLYMSPEQARGAKDIGSPTDLYSVGAILYHVLVGTPPFSGETYNEVLAKLLMEPHRPLAEVRPGMPAALAQLVDAMLDKDANRRPGARDAAASLRRIASTQDERGALDSTMAAGPDTAVQKVALAAATPVPLGGLAPVPGTEVPAGAAVAAGTVVPGLPAASASAASGTTPAGTTSRKGLVLALGAAAVVIAAGVAVVATRGADPGAPTSAAAGTSADAATEIVRTAPVPAPVPPPVAAPPDAAPAVERVTITLVATPAEATWTLDGAALEGNPARVERARGSRHVAIAHAPGHREIRLELAFETSHAENIALLAVGKPGGGGGKKPPPGETRPPPGETRPPPGDSGLTIDKNNPFKKNP